MTERPDPFVVLQALRPVTDHHRLEIGEVPHAEALLVHVLERAARPVTVLPSRSRRRWVVAASVVTGSLVVASAAAAILWQRQSGDEGVVACWSEAPSPDARRFEMRIDAGDDPVAACARLWTDGTFATTGQPPSQACAAGDGATAVIPGGASACSLAGFEPIEPSAGDGGAPDEATVNRLSARLAQTFLDVCLDEPASRTEAEAALDDEGLDEWSVVVSIPFSTDRPCGTARISTDERRIVIAAVPPEPEGGD